MCRLSVSARVTPRCFITLDTPHLGALRGLTAREATPDGHVGEVADPGAQAEPSAHPSVTAGTSDTPDDVMFELPNTGSSNLLRVAAWFGAFVSLTVSQVSHTDSD